MNCWEQLYNHSKTKPNKFCAHIIFDRLQSKSNHYLIVNYCLSHEIFSHFAFYFKHIFSMLTAYLHGKLAIECRPSHKASGNGRFPCIRQEPFLESNKREMKSVLEYINVLWDYIFHLSTATIRLNLHFFHLKPSFSPLVFNSHAWDSCFFSNQVLFSGSPVQYDMIFYATKSTGQGPILLLWINLIHSMGK